MKKSILTYIPPDFDLDHNLDKPYVSHGLDDLVERVRHIPFLSSLSDLFKLWPEKVDAHLLETADESNSISLSSNEAKKKFDSGLSLLFNDANRFDETLNDWLEELREYLNLSKMTYARNLLYATPSGGGSAPHFDQNINLILQLSGEKKWWIAPNKSVQNPLTRYVIGSEPDFELKTYCSERMPNQMPDDAVEITLKKGSLLFLPRGYWHRTEAQSDALALNFTFSAPSWLDLLGSVLRLKLAQSEKWRGTAQTSKEKSLRFEELLRELSQGDLDLSAEEILELTES